ncbi:MAG: hypothetical protein ACR2RV_10915 [Verrucomicrobiales bacterium]
MTTIRLLALATLTAIQLPIPSADAQELTLEFQLLRMKAKVADFLEMRLLTGGDQSTEAEEKLPGLISARTIESVATHSFQCRGNNRSESRSSPKDLEEEGGEKIPEGFYFEVEPVIGSDGTIHLNYYATHAIDAPRKPIHVLRIQSGVNLRPGRINFLQRWSSPQGELVLIVKPTVPDAAAGDPAPGSKFRTIHAMAALYKVADIAARDALVELARTNPDAAEAAIAKDGTQVDAIGTTTISGLRQEVRSYTPSFEEAEGMVYEDGLNLQFELTAGPAGQRIDTIVDLQHFSPTGKRARAEGGDRTDERQIFHGAAKRELTAGALCLFPCEVELVPGGAGRKPAPYILAIRCRCYGEFGPPPAPRKPIAAGEPAAMVNRTYAVPPSFLRRLQEKNLKPPAAQAGLIRRATAKEVLEASGIDFPGRTRAVFVAQMSELVLYHNRAAHQRLEELLANHEGDQ